MDGPGKWVQKITLLGEKALLIYLTFPCPNGRWKVSLEGYPDFPTSIGLGNVKGVGSIRV